MLRLSSNMKAGPDIAMVASLVGDPARANMLTALMTGRALTASELAHQAGITPQTASSHLSKLEAGGLIEQEKQGRHRYYRLSRSRRRRRARRPCGACRPRRPHARAHRAEGSGAAPRADLLRPSRRRSRRADARQPEEAAAGAPAQAGHRADRRGRALPGKRLADLMPIRWPIRAARCARPASTGASGAIISRARWAPRS